MAAAIVCLRAGKVAGLPSGRRTGQTGVQGRGRELLSLPAGPLKSCASWSTHSGRHMGHATPAGVRGRGPLNPLSQGRGATGPLGLCPYTYTGGVDTEHELCVYTLCVYVST